jgi:7-cyano-7-deazaguanine reductase
MTTYFDTYNPTLLFPVARAASRQHSISSTPVHFSGSDTWNCYEVTWLGQNNYPHEATLRITYPASTPSLIESKSLKLYLMSFSMMQFSGLDALVEVVKSDLAITLKCPPDQIEIAAISTVALAVIKEPRGKNLDNTLPSISSFSPSPELLEYQTAPSEIRERYYSNCLRSLCPLTGQPDFGTVEIFYEGLAPNEPSLARYIVSLRNHGGYHEHCCEMIFNDINNRLKPHKLAIRCTYTRRGGIDISPVRYSPGAEDALPYQRLPRC